MRGVYNSIAPCLDVHGLYIPLMVSGDELAEGCFCKIEGMLYEVLVHSRAV